MLHTEQTETQLRERYIDARARAAAAMLGLPAHEVQARLRERQPVDAEAELDRLVLAS